MHHLIGCGWSGKHLKKAGLGRVVNAYQNCCGSLGVSKLMFVDDRPFVLQGRRKRGEGSEGHSKYISKVYMIAS